MQRPRFVDRSSPRGWAAEKRRSAFDQRWALLWERTRARRILCGFLLGPNQRSPSPSLNGIVEAARGAGNPQNGHGDEAGDPFPCSISEARTARCETEEAGSQAQRHSLHSSQHARCPLGSPPPFSAAPGQCLSCRPAKTVVSCHGAPGRTGTGACPVPSRRNPPILVECLLFSFSPALSPSTSHSSQPLRFLFLPPHTRFPLALEPLSLTSGSVKEGLFGLATGQRRKTTTRVSYYQVGLLDPLIPRPPRASHPDRDDVHSGTINCRRVGKHRDARGSGLPVHRLGSSTREEERRSRSLGCDGFVSYARRPAPVLHWLFPLRPVHPHSTPSSSVPKPTTSPRPTAQTNRSSFLAPPAACVYQQSGVQTRHIHERTRPSRHPGRPSFSPLLSPLVDSCANISTLFCSSIASFFSATFTA